MLFKPTLGNTRSRASHFHGDAVCCFLLLLFSSKVNPGVYQIPYGVMVPSATEATNLLVVSAMAATHIGLSSLRMEPQFMIVGQAAGTYYYACSTYLLHTSTCTHTWEVASRRHVMLPPPSVVKLLQSHCKNYVSPAGTAAALAVDSSVTVQDVNASVLQRSLVDAGARVFLPPASHSFP